MHRRKNLRKSIKIISSKNCCNSLIHNTNIFRMLILGYEFLFWNYCLDISIFLHIIISKWEVRCIQIEILITLLESLWCSKHYSKVISVIPSHSMCLLWNQLSVIFAPWEYFSSVGAINRICWLTEWSICSFI